MVAYGLSLSKRECVLVSFTWASHIAASVLTGRQTLPNQSTNQSFDSIFPCNIISFFHVKEDCYHMLVLSESFMNVSSLTRWSRSFNRHRQTSSYTTKEAPIWNTALNWGGFKHRFTFIDEPVWKISWICLINVFMQAVIRETCHAPRIACHFISHNVWLQWSISKMRIKAQGCVAMM